MKSNKSLLTVILVALVAIAMSLVYLAAPGLAAEPKGKDLVGSWYATITVPAQNAEVPGLMSFTSDGIVISDEVPSPLETSGHGNWVKTGPNEAAYAFVFLTGDPTPGKWVKGTVTGKLKYSPKTDEWSGPFNIVMVDQAGNPVMSDTGTMSGTRISAKP